LRRYVARLPDDMALNPFERLELLVAEPRQAFEDLVGMLLEDLGLIDGRIRVFRGDSGVDAYSGSFAEGEQVTVYQCKYFTKRWEITQTKQINDSFETANNGCRLKEWFLCIPVRPTIHDVRWFDNWARDKPVPVELLDGDALTKMLSHLKAGRTRQRFRDWGVFAVRDGFPVIQARIRCIKLDSKTGQTFRLVVSIENRGDRTAEDLRVRLSHSDTHCVPARHDERLWKDIGSGQLNPRHLQAGRDLHSGEEIQVLQIPLVAVTPFPFTIALEVWLRDQGSSRQFLTLDANQLQGGNVIDFHPGEAEAESGSRRWVRSKPTGVATKRSSSRFADRNCGTSKPDPVWSRLFWTSSRRSDKGSISGTSGPNRQHHRDGPNFARKRTGVACHSRMVTSSRRGGKHSPIQVE
jgi:hypothetical protein